MRTLVASDEEPVRPLPVDLFVHPVRNPGEPDGPLIWRGSLVLLSTIGLVAETLPELVEEAKQRVEHILPEENPPLRILLVPDGDFDSMPRLTTAPADVVEIRLSPLEGWNGDSYST